MLRSIQKLIGDKRKQLIFPIFLMSLDAMNTIRHRKRSVT